MRISSQSYLDLFEEMAESDKKTRSKWMKIAKKYGLLKKKNIKKLIKSKSYKIK